jgi:hypothetical protein
MSNDKKQDAEHKADDKEKKEAESDDQKKQESDGAARPADDDIIIK